MKTGKLGKVHIIMFSAQLINEKLDIERIEKQDCHDDGGQFIVFISLFFISQIVQKLLHFVAIFPKIETILKVNWGYEILL